MTSAVTRWAMIGTGGMAARIIKDFAATENVELTTVASRSRDKAADFAAQWNVPHPLDLDDLWEFADVDVVYIATPHPTHHPLAEAAIGAGKNVVVEKPITMNAGEARHLVDLARSAGVFLMEAMWTRFNPAVVKVRELVEAGAIGPVRSVQASFGFPVPFDAAHRLWDVNLGAGSVLDGGIYPISLAHLFLGKPSSVYARGTLLTSGVDCDATMVLEYAGGARAVLGSSMTAHLPLTAAVGGSGGLLRLDAPCTCPRGYSISDMATGFDGRHVDVPVEGAGYVHMLRAVSEAVMLGQTEHPFHLLDDTIEVMEVVDEVIHQIRSTHAGPHAPT